MTFISYAQNFEDVMLWRALRHVENGFYIDVGAGHPDDYSVTRAFYDRGWQGINVEPSVQFYARLAAVRERDINLNKAVGDETGGASLFEVAGSGLSTLVPSIATTHRDAGWHIERRAIEQITLGEICRRHAPLDVHFLKVDAEGSERAAFAGADFASFRPWIILVEATQPLSQEQNHADWEPIVVSADYRFAWFDGLNRFYIANERWEQLSSAFVAPPNIFDDFIRATDTEYLNRIVASESRAASEAARAATLTEDLGKACASEQAARDKLAAAIAETDRLRSEMAVEKAETDRLRGEMAVEKAGTDRLRSEMAVENAETDRLRAQVSAASTESERLQMEMAATTTRNEALIVDAARARAEGATALRREEVAEARMAELEIDLVRRELDDQALRSWVAAYQTSTSWRVTQPLRDISLLLQGLRSRR